MNASASDKATSCPGGGTLFGEPRRRGLPDSGKCPVCGQWTQLTRRRPALWFQHPSLFGRKETPVTHDSVGGQPQNQGLPPCDAAVPARVG